MEYSATNCEPDIPLGQTGDFGDGKIFRKPEVVCEAEGGKDRDEEEACGDVPHPLACGITNDETEHDGWQEPEVPVGTVDERNPDVCFEEDTCGGHEWY